MKLYAPAAFALAALFSATANAQLRVVTYNTLDKPFDATDEAELRTIFEAIADTPRNGIAKRPDVIALQEQRSFTFTDSTASRIADDLNDLFGVTSYQTLTNGFGLDQVAFVYDSAAVSLESSLAFNAGGPRATIRAEFQPVGYDSPDATFYQYTSHFKAGSTSSDRSTRATEATTVRNNANALGSDTNIIYTGDFNFGSSFETGYLNLIAAGAAQAVDPIALASWPSALTSQHLTQSTRTFGFSDGGAGGGIDDRFDLQLVTDDLLDGEGLSYLGPTSAGLSGLQHSHQAFGNDGVSYNQAINNTLVGRSQPASVLTALLNFSDHLPVVADYQLPAVLDVAAATIPSTLELGESFQLDVTITNAADVVASVGADELDYTFSAVGGVTGTSSGQGSVLALTAGDTFQLTLDTSSLGVQSGTLTVETSSLAAANALVEVPISFEVISPALPGDYNGNGVVDAADYTLWADGSTSDTTIAGYNLWADNFGSTASSSAAIPEPTAAVLGFVALARTLRRRG